MIIYFVNIHSYAFKFLLIGDKYAEIPSLLSQIMKQNGSMGDELSRRNVMMLTKMTKTIKISGKIVNFQLVCM